MSTNQQLLEDVKSIAERAARDEIVACLEILIRQLEEGKKDPKDILEGARNAMAHRVMNEIPNALSDNNERR